MQIIRRFYNKLKEPLSTIEFWDKYEDAAERVGFVCFLGVLATLIFSAVLGIGYAINPSLGISALALAQTGVIVVLPILFGFMLQMLLIYKYCYRMRRYHGSLNYEREMEEREQRVWERRIQEQMEERLMVAREKGKLPDDLFEI